MNMLRARIARAQEALTDSSSPETVDKGFLHPSDTLSMDAENAMMLDRNHIVSGLKVRLL